jgi:hypothetical protein
VLTAKNISYLQTINNLLPRVGCEQPVAIVCNHCSYVNETFYSFCTNCGFPLKDPQLVSAFNEKQQQRNHFLFKAETAVMFARVVLYVIAAFLSLGIFFIFVNSTKKYIIVTMAVLLSGLFFFLAFWSQRKPFTSLLTAFIILIVFSAINIFGKLQQSFTTLEGMTGMLLCIALLFVVCRAHTVLV